MQRYNFQFTGQRFYRIVNGRLAGQLRERGVSSHHHRLLGRHGGRRRLVDLGARRRLQLRQGPTGAGGTGVHGCPAVLVRGVNVLNAREESGR